MISAARWLAKWQQKMSSSSTPFHTLLPHFKSIECEFRFNRLTLCSRFLFAPQNFDLILFRQALYWCRPSRNLPTRPRRLRPTNVCTLCDWLVAKLLLFGFSFGLLLFICLPLCMPCKRALRMYIKREKEVWPRVPSECYTIFLNGIKEMFFKFPFFKFLLTSRAF